MEKKDKKEENFGMPDLSFKPIERGKSTPTKPKVPAQAGAASGTTGDAKSGDNRTFVVVSVIIIILLLGVAGYLTWKNDFFGKKQQEAPVVLKPEPVTETPVEAVEEEKKEEVQGGTRYYVIVGGFRIKENAERLQSKLISQGMKSRIIEPDSKSSMFRVSAYDFATLDEALQKRESIKGNFDLSIWVLIK